MSLNDSPQFYQVTSKLSHEIFLVVPIWGAFNCSVIFECFDAEGNEAHFNNEQYSIHVSHNAYDDFVAEDPYDFYNIMLVGNDPRWIFLRKVFLGTDVRCSNSYTPTNQGTYGALNHFKYSKFTVPEISGKKVRITAGTK